MKFRLPRLRRLQVLGLAGIALILGVATYVFLDANTNAAPGGVTSGLRLWLKGDSGMNCTTDGCAVNQWLDQSGDARNATVGAGSFVRKNAALNFNPALSFDQNEWMTGNSLFGTGTYNDVNFYIVSNKTIVNTGADFDEAVAGGAFVRIHEPYSDNITYWDAGGAGVAPRRLTAPAGTLTTNQFQLKAFNASTTNGQTFSGANQAISVNGKRITSDADYASFTGQNSQYLLGAHGGDSTGAEDYAEVIAYGGPVSASEHQKIQSYLAAKYGITLDQTTAADYVGSGGATFWSATQNTGYNKNITVIGRDDTAQLNQKQSVGRSDGTLTIGLGDIAADNGSNASTFAGDNRYVAVADNGADTKQAVDVTGVASVKRINRIWKVQETGNVGTVKLRIPVGILANSSPRVMTSSDATFTSADTSSSLVLNGSVYEGTIDLNDGEYLTFASSVGAPGGVTAGLNLWLKADDVTTNTAQNVTNWHDRSGLDRNADMVFGDPQRIQNGSNFNPTIRFDGDDYLRFTTSPFANTFTSGEVFSLVKAGAPGCVCGGPVDFGNGSRASHYPLNNNVVYEGFGTNDRFGWDPSTKAIADAKTGVATVGGPSVDVFKQHIFNVGSATNDWHIGFDGTNAAQSSTNTPSFALASGNEHIGAVSGYVFNGDIGETFLYNRKLTVAERSRVNSYMAIKYGQSIDQTVAQNYVDSAAATVWDATANATYKNDIAGIGRDDASALNQKQSASMATGNPLTIGNNDVAVDNSANSNNFGTDKSFLIWGHNGGSTAFATNVGGTTPQLMRMARTWTTQETGTVGIVKMRLAGGSVPTGSPVMPVMLVSDDAIFDSTDVQVPLMRVNGDYEATIDLTSGQFFTFATTDAAPGGISGEALWLRADRGTSSSTDNTALSAWNDSSPSGNHASQATIAIRPIFKNNPTDNHNFNPTVGFNGAGQRLLVNGTQLPTGTSARTVFVLTSNAPVAASTPISWGDPGAASFGTRYAMELGGGARYLESSNSRYGNTGGNTTLPSITSFSNTANVTPSAAQMRVNGASVGNVFSCCGNSTLNTMSTPTAFIGANVLSGGANTYNGLLSEVIVYPTVLTATQQQQVESYLSIKYGLTLNSGNTNYLASDSTVVWDATANTTYKNDIAGIGRDDDADLNQKQSTSTNSSGIVTIGNSDIATDNTSNNNNFSIDKSFLMWGHDGASTAANTTVVGSSTHKRMDRVWNVQKTGNVGTVKVRIPKASLPGLQPQLIRSTDTTFATTDTVMAMTLNGGNYEATVTLDDNDFFTFAAFQTAPGGVSSGLHFWFKADGDSPVNGANNLTGAIDETGRYSTTGWTVVGDPQKQANSLNFNPSINFDGDDYLGRSDGQATAFTQAEKFVVSRNQPGVAPNNGVPFRFGENSAAGNSHYTYSNQYYYNTFCTNERKTWHPGSKVVAEGGGTTAGPSVAPSDWHILDMRSQTNNWVHDFDGVTAYTDTVSAVSCSGTFMYLGAHESFVYYGDMPEAIAYSRALTTDERARVNSYTAIKYGLTLGNTTAPQEYKASDSTTIWPADAGYQTNVAGIGRDDASGLSQKQSTSTNSGDVITIGNGDLATDNQTNTNNFAADKSFLVWGNNNASMTQQASVTGSTLVRTNRIWKTQDSGNTGTVKVRIPATTLAGNVPTLIRSTDATFNSSDTFVTMTLNGSFYEATTDFADGISYFSLASAVVGPGGVAGASLWLRSDIGTSTTTDNVTVNKWSDMSLSKNDATQLNFATQPVYKNNPIDNVNFNSVVKFDGADDFLNIDGTKLPSGTSSRTLISAAMPTNTASTRYTMSWGGAATSQGQGLATVAGGAGYYVGYGDDTASPAGLWQNNVVNSMIGTWAGNGGNTNIYSKAKLVAGPTVKAWNTPSVAGARIGGTTWAGEYWSGSIGENVVYPRELNANERQRVDSYLSIRNGYTLDQTAPTNYLISDSSVVWDATANATYKNDIAGVGRDDASALNQKQSRSGNAGNIVTIGLGTLVATNSQNSNSFSADKSFLVWGHNGVPITQRLPLTGTSDSHLSRIWKAQETGSVGTIKVQVPVSALTGTNPQLVRSSDATFTSADSQIPLTLNGSNYEATVDLANGDYFTFSSLIIAPGGVLSSGLWLRGDAGMSCTTDNCSVTQWQDQSTNARHANLGGGTLSRKNAGLNFNPALLLDVNEWMGGASLFGTATFNDLNIYMVSNKTVVGVGTDFYEATTGSGLRLHLPFTDNVTYWDAGGSTAPSRLTAPAGSIVLNQFELKTYNASTSSGQTIPGVMQAIGKNGKILTSDNTMTAYTGSNGQYYLGAFPGDATGAEQYAEIIAYTTPITANEQQRVHSYNAIKYGVTLDQTTATDYLASDSSVIWSGTANAAYKNNITGIGRDDASALNQKQSKSISAPALVTAGNGNTIAADNAGNSNNFAADKSFLAFGDNNGTLDWTNTGAPSSRGILQRGFKAQSTGTVGSLKIQVPDNGAGLTTKLPAEVGTVYLLTDADGDFTAGATEIPMTLVGANWEANAAIPSGYFTFATDVPPPPDMTAATDTGISNVDNVTNDTTPTFTGSCVNGETITLAVDTVAITPTQVCAGGIYTITPSAALAEGNHTVTSKSSASPLISQPLAFTIDATPPAAPATAPDMTAATDTGTSNTDNVTNDNTPDFTGSCVDGETVSVYSDGALIGTQLCTGSAYTVTTSPALTDGVHTITAKFTDAAGNQSAASPVLNITIDTTPPVNLAAPDMTAATDTGVSNTDNITGNTQPIFTGSCVNGDTITLQVDGTPQTPTQVCAGGVYNLTPSAPLVSGSYSATTTATDAAGQQSAPSPALPFTIDATPPAAPATAPDMTAATDTGISNIDNVTKNQTPNFTGVCTNGETVRLLVDSIVVGSQNCVSGSYTIAPSSAVAAGNHTATATFADTAGNISPESPALPFTIDITPPTTLAAPDMTAATDTGVSDIDNNTNNSQPTFTGSCTSGDVITLLVNGINVGQQVCSANAYTITPGVPISDGSFTATVTAADASGNVSAQSSGLPFSVDTSAPTTPALAPDMTAATDTGVSNTDNATGNDQPTFTGACTNGEIANLLVDGLVVASQTCAGGVYNLTPGSTIGDGGHTAAATFTDAAGNVSGASPVLPFSVDTAAPTALVAPDMTAATDTGVSNTDNNTGNNQASFMGNCVTGTLVSLYADAALVGQANCIAGNYTVTLTAPLADGGYAMTATATDTAGNVSSASPGLPIVVDTTAPTAPATAPDMTAATDTGVSNTDNITNDTTPTFTGNCVNGDLMTLVIDGTPGVQVTCAAGVYNLTPSGTIADGVHTATMTITDPAGNPSSGSPALNFTVDTVAPIAPVITSPTTGATTNDNTPTINGTGENGATITVTDQNNATVCTATVSGGTWTCTATTIADGPQTFKAVQTDVAGNVSPQSNSVAVIVDTAAPSAPVIVSPVDGSSTNDNTPTISGTGEPNSVLHLSIDGGAAFDTPVDAAGNWTFTPAGSLTNGAHTLTATQTDSSGNTGPSTAVTNFTVDTSALSVTVNQKAGQADPTAANSIFFTVVFNKPIDATTFGLGDITLGTSPNSPSTYIAGFTQLSPTTWEFEVKGMDNGTTVTATIAANVAQDPASNNNLASTSTDNSVLYQVPPPNVVPQITNDTTPTLTGQCAPNNNLQIDLSGPASHTYNTTCNGSGTWTVTVPVGDALLDGTYNIVTTDTTVGSLTNPLANQTSALVVDTVVPTVTVNQKAGQADPTSVNSASFTIVFSEVMVAGTFTTNDLTVAGTTGTVTGFTQLSPTTWEATVTGMTSNDTVTLSLTAGKATDIAGNNNAVSTSIDNSVTYDTTPPSAPVITAPASGSTTSDSTPTITGTGENGATIVVIVDGSNIICAEGSPIAVSGGTWTCTPTVALADGPHAITATQTDTSGNTSPTSGPTNVTIDTSAPSTLAAPDMTAGTDSGTSNTDNLTADATPNFTGACTPGDTVTLYAGGSFVGQQVCAASSYTITSNVLASGPHAMTVTSTDSVGNVSLVSPALTITIDATSPVTPAAPDMTAGTDSGTSNTDNLTADATPDFTGACVSGDTVTLYADGVSVGLQVCPAGATYTITSSPALADGNHSMQTTATDSAGNTSAMSPALAIMVDITSPSAPIITAPVSGSTTNDSTPTITGTGEDGSVISISIDGTPITCAEGSPITVTSGTWTCTPTTPLADGTHTVFATQTDPAGNTSIPSMIVNLNVDTTPPPALAAPDMTSGTDTGTSNTDNLTTDSTPNFTGTCTPGDTVKLYADGTPVGQQVCPAGGSYAITPSPVLSDGLHAMTVTATDSTGNTSAVSPALNITVDSTAPVALAAPDMTPATDSGISNSDNLTNDSTPDFTGTCTPNETVTLYVDAVAAGQQVCPIGGSYTVTLVAGLSNGSHTIQATTTDAAGNESALSPSLPIIVDTIAPAAPAITSPASGSTSGDVTPTITGTGENSAAITVLVDGVPVVCAEGNPVVVSGGTWTCTPTVALADGPHAITATQTDRAGNTSPVSTPTNLTIDTTAPAQPAAPDLTPGTDSGTSNTDNLTNDVTPDFTGTCTPGDTIMLYAGSTLVGQQVCPVGGVYSIASSPLGNGSHAMTTTVTDPIGNVSVSSPALNVTIDSAAPAQPAAPDLTPGTDSGTSNTDNNTADSTPDFTGVCTPGDTLNFYVDGVLANTQVCPAGGSYTFTPSTPLGDGLHNITLTVTDLAGNTSAPSTPLPVTIDTTADPAPVVTSPVPGSSTNDATPTFTGTGQPGGTVTLLDGGTIICTAVVAADGAWSCTSVSPMPEATYNLTITGTDAAGNPTATAPYTVTVDVTAGPPPAITSPTDGEELTDTTPTFTGVGEPGSTITIRDEYGNILCTATVDGAGNWSCQSTKNLGEGEHEIVATQTDLAGNTVSSPALTVSIAVNTDDAPAAIENGAPNGGDANGDGVADSQQGDVTSIPDKVTGGYSTLAISGGACPNVRHFEVDTEGQLSKQDPPYDYPIGLRGFELDCFAVGGTVNVSIYLNKLYNTSQWVYRKFDSATQTYRDISSLVNYGVATIGGNQVTTISYSATDGGELDEDGVANGTFKDPSGPAITVEGQLVNTGEAIGLSIWGGSLLMLAGAAVIVAKKMIAHYRQQK